MLKPLGDRVILEVEKEEEKTVVPDSPYGVVHRADFCGDSYGNRSGGTVFKVDL